VFGDRDFEVARTSAGVLQTLKPVAGCTYDLYLDSTQGLVVKEIDLERVSVQVVPCCTHHMPMWPLTDHDLTTAAA
jgi:hypothetical protein